MQTNRTKAVQIVKRIAAKFKTPKRRPRAALSARIERVINQDWTSRARVSRGVLTALRQIERQLN